jgi:hypothetical protein
MVKRLFIVNLLLQCFDGLLSYQAFLVGAVETNPLVAAAICSWGVIYGLVYKNVFACALLLLTFTLRQRHPSLVMRAMVATASV